MSPANNSQKYFREESELTVKELHEEQHGFIKRKACVTNLLEILDLL